MFHIKLVLLLTDVLQSYLSASVSASPCLRDTFSFILLRYQNSRGMSHYTTHTVIWISYGHQFSLSLFQAFTDHFKSTNYNWYHCHFHLPQLFQLSSKIQVFFILMLSFMAKSSIWQWLLSVSWNHVIVCKQMIIIKYKWLLETI